MPLTQITKAIDHSLFALIPSVGIVIGMQFDDAGIICNEMRMSHVYQPVMLIELLARNGSASVREIANLYSEISLCAH